MPKRARSEYEAEASVASDDTLTDGSQLDNPEQLEAARQVITHYNAVTPEDNELNIEQRLQNLQYASHVRENIESEGVRAALREAMSPELIHLKGEIDAEYNSTLQYADRLNHPGSILTGDSERFGMLAEVNAERQVQAGALRRLGDHLTATSDIPGLEDQVRDTLAREQIEELQLEDHLDEEIAHVDYLAQLYQADRSPHATHPGQYLDAYDDRTEDNARSGLS